MLTRSIWLLPFVAVTALCLAGFGAYIMAPATGSRVVSWLVRYCCLPLDVLIVVFCVKYIGSYNSPVFMIMVLLCSVWAPVVWLWKGGNTEIRLYAVYLLATMAFWIVLHLWSFHPEHVVASIYYGSLLVTVIWLAFSRCDVFAVIDGTSWGVFLLVWVGVMLLDVVMFQVVPFFTDGITMFTTIPWAYGDPHGICSGVPDFNAWWR